MPPSRTMGLVEFFVPSEAKTCFKNLAYKQFKDIPLFLEWAPIGIFKESQIGHLLQTQGKVESEQDSKQTPTEVLHKELDIEDENVRTIYVKNLSFSTTEESLLRLVESTVGSVNSVSIAKRNIKVFISII